MSLPHVDSDTCTCDACYATATIWKDARNAARGYFTPKRIAPQDVDAASQHMVCYGEDPDLLDPLCKGCRLFLPCWTLRVERADRRILEQRRAAQQQPRRPKKIAKPASPPDNDKPERRIIL